jgi:hypothetical protein
MLLNRILCYLAISSFLLFAACLSYPLIWNYLVFRSTLNVILIEKVGLNTFEIKEEWIDSYFLDPSGYFWVVLDKGFDPSTIRKAQISFVKYAPKQEELSKLIIPEDAPKFVKSHFRYETFGFEGYVATYFYVGISPLCPEFIERDGQKIKIADTINHESAFEITPLYCSVELIAKEGDRNVFIQLSFY